MNIKLHSFINNVVFSEKTLLSPNRPQHNRWQDYKIYHRHTSEDKKKVTGHHVIWPVIRCYWPMTGRYFEP